MQLLIDGDLIGYRCAASCQPTKAKDYQEPLDVAIRRVDDLMNRILYTWDTNEYKLFIGGSENYRYQIDPTYKANRKDVPRPEWLQPCREYLVTQWGATITDGVEADDALGIHQTDATMICSLDKDLLQVPGYHWNWVKEEQQYVDEHTGWVNFYTQLIMGDRADNIAGYDGKMRQTVPKFLIDTINKLNECPNQLAMYNMVNNMYELGYEKLQSNAQLLYIQRSEGDMWQKPE